MECSGKHGAIRPGINPKPSTATDSTNGIARKLTVMEWMKSHKTSITTSCYGKSVLVNSVGSK